MQQIRDIFSKAGTDDAILKELDELENSGISNFKKRLFHEELEKGYRKLLNRVSGILKILEFNRQTSNPEIYKAIEYYQQKDSPKDNSRAPLEFLGKSERKWLFDRNGKCNDSLYKAFIFKAIFDHIKSGSLNLLFSERYKSVDDYLIHPERWEENKQEPISRAGLKRLNKSPQEIIDFLKDVAKNQYQTTNEHITDNPYIRFNARGIAKVTTPKSSDIQAGILPECIGTDKYISLTQILSDIRYCTDYILSFTHYSVKSSKTH